MLLTTTRAAVAGLRSNSNIDDNANRAVLNTLLDDLNTYLGAQVALQRTTTLVLADAGAGNATISGRLKDGAGVNVAERGRLLLSLHSAATGAAADIGTATAGANTAVSVLVTDAVLVVDTHTDGTWAVAFDTVANPDDLFARASVLPVIASSVTVAA